jgi:hypothetical protein
LRAEERKERAAQLRLPVDIATQKETSHN